MKKGTVGPIGTNGGNDTSPDRSATPRGLCTYSRVFFVQDFGSVTVAAAWRPVHLLMSRPGSFEKALPQRRYPLFADFTASQQSGP